MMIFVLEMNNCVLNMMKCMKGARYERRQLSEKLHEELREGEEDG